MEDYLTEDGVCKNCGEAFDPTQSNSDDLDDTALDDLD